MEEIWKVINDYGMYSISSWGRIYSHRKNKIMSPQKDRHGYLRVHLVGSVKKEFGIHQLVAITFVSGREPNKEVNHIDYDRTNNKSENLEWVTRKENMIHSRERCGVKTRGENHPKSIVTNRQARRMKYLRSVGLLYWEIALIYNINYMSCRNIIKKGYSDV